MQLYGLFSGMTELQDCIIIQQAIWQRRDGVLQLCDELQPRRLLIAGWQYADMTTSKRISCNVNKT
jgi:hypothetical protein